MKVLQLIYTLESGGAERFVVDLSNALAKNNVIVYLCTLKDDTKKLKSFYKSEVSSEVNYMNLGFKDGFNPKNVWDLFKLIRKIKPDIVHCHQNLVVYIFPLIILFPKVKFFHTIHNDASKEIKNQLEYILKRFFYKYGRMRVITISKASAESFEVLYKSKKHSLVLNGRKKPVKTLKIKEVNSFINELKSKYEVVLLHVARFAKQKNQLLLYESIDKINSSEKKIGLVVIGNGFKSQEAIKLQKMYNDIYILGEKNNVSDYYYSCDGFCLSSIHEGMPITLIEAFACGCMPICTPVGGIVNMIQNRYNGFLSESLSTGDYISALSDYLNNRDKINKEVLFQEFDSKYNIDICARKHISLYKSK